MDKKKSNFIHKLLRSNNMHNLIIDKIKLKNNVNDHFEDLKKRQHIYFNNLKLIIVFLEKLITNKV
jgi:hypothetical protein